MTSESTAGSPPLSRRLWAWSDRIGLRRKLAVLLAAAAVLSGLATYAALTESQFTADPNTVQLLLVLDLALMLMLGAVVASRIVRLWSERRRGSAGSRLHVRLVVLFGFLAAAPAIVVAVFSVLFFNLGIEAWFSEKVRTALDESRAVAEAYVEEHRQNIRADLLAMANDLGREGFDAIANPRRFGQLVVAQAALRSLTEAVVFDGRGRVLARAGLTWTLELEGVPAGAVERADAGEVVIFNPDADDTTTARNDRVRALVRLDDVAERVYLLVGRFIEARVVEHADRTRRAVVAYQTLEGQRSEYQITFALIFGVVAFLLLLSAVWMGLVMATRMAHPISQLIAAAERVRSGDLAARVGEPASDDEIGALSRAFNRMTSQLEHQREELVAANRQIDERRRFIEAVLAGTSAGVVGLDRSGRINLLNRAASQLLATDLDRRIGEALPALVPEMEALVEAAAAAPTRLAQGQINIMCARRQRTFLVRVAAERDERETVGFVVTFDDVSEILAVQRKAAWADVARRIAHEIKNPLTPIQLSAERLKRRYLSEIVSDPETFRQCTETIVRQVADIGRMVDEFSAFARMPAPVMRDEDLVDLCRQAIFLQYQGSPEIEFAIVAPPQPVLLPCDARQIRQALTNLLKNAIEAIQGREGQVSEGEEPGSLPRGRIAVSVVSGVGETRIDIEDNGRGLPLDERDRLTEPYVTTRSKGTGLGLAIVKKIMEDHGGELTLEDREGGGACIRMIFRRNDTDSAAESKPTVYRLKALHGS